MIEELDCGALANESKSLGFSLLSYRLKNTTRLLKELNIALLGLVGNLV